MQVGPPPLPQPLQMTYLVKVLNAMQQTVASVHETVGMDTFTDINLPKSFHLH